MGNIVHAVRNGEKRDFAIEEWNHFREDKYGWKILTEEPEEVTQLKQHATTNPDLGTAGGNGDSPVDPGSAEAPKVSVLIHHTLTEKDFADNPTLHNGGFEVGNVVLLPILTVENPSTEETKPDNAEPGIQQQPSDVPTEAPKLNAAELSQKIYEAQTIEDIDFLVSKDETRKTVLSAAEIRRKQLLQL